RRELSCWLVYWVSLIFLILMGCSNSLLVRGVSIDAEEPGGDSMIFPCYFIRNLLAKQREEKKVEMFKRVVVDAKNEINNSNFVQSVQVKEFSA
ncbi:hypothetical protein HHI36_008727, partial [Cryptolaemus montrouzieri]